MSRLGPCRGAWCSAGGVGSRPFGSRAGSGPGTSQLGCGHAGRAPCARTALSVGAVATGVVPPEGGDGSSRSSHQTRVEPRSCQAPHVSQSWSTTNNPRPPGVSGSGGSMPGLRREPGSVTAIRTRSSSVVTSTVSARRGPTFAWTTLLVTSSLTTSAASDAVLAGMRPSSCERTHLRARVGASSPPGIRREIDPCEPPGWDADAVMRRPASEAVAAAT